MIILAWIAVIIPAAILLLGMLAVLTDGFTAWKEFFIGVLVAIIIFAVGIATMLSVEWGIKTLQNHYTPKAEKESK